MTKRRSRRSRGLWKNKLAAVGLILATVPCILLEGDATATVFVAMFAVPMFFSRQQWFY